MASLRERLPENVDGEFYVDRSCIDCETCMIVAPEIFAESSRGMSYVHHQPAGDAETRRAMMAMIACPTASIGTALRRTSPEAARAFPEEILPDVYYCGYASEDSFGASSYLIRRPEGNVLVDSPRAAGPLLARIEALGGARWMFLTHRDDVADHAKFRARFGVERLMMRDDARGMECERRLEGVAPIALSSDLTVIPVPGHTRGSACLLWRDEVLFSGDHLWADADGRLDASRGVAWHSWAEQTASMELLLAWRFRVVLPGHGRRYVARDAEAAHEELARLVARMKR